jgi:hypothetical protein
MAQFHLRCRPASTRDWGAQVLPVSLLLASTSWGVGLTNFFVPRNRRPSLSPRPIEYSEPKLVRDLQSECFAMNELSEERQHQ